MLKKEEKKEKKESKSKLKSYAVMSTTFEVDPRYVIIEPIGTGAYGVVVSAQDTMAADPENNMVAIKKIEKAFEQKTYAKRTLREIRILRLLNHENVVKLKSLQMPEAFDKFNDLYQIFELMDTDLATIIKSPQPLSAEHCQFFLYQVLRGMKYIHSAGILHRDLKPRNLLVNSNCDLKICDFGLSRADLAAIQAKVPAMTDYVATRWYRSPELLLSNKNYTKAVDVWSIGCIFAELLGRKPLFPGSDTKNQFDIILDILGSPTEEEIEHFHNVEIKEFLKSQPKRKPKSLESMFPSATPIALDLLKRLLMFDESKRITIDQALEHPYLEELHDPTDEPVTSPVALYDFEFEKFSLTVAELKKLIYEEAELYHSPSKMADYLASKAAHPEGVLAKRGMGRLKDPFKK